METTDVIRPNEPGHNIGQSFFSAVFVTVVVAICCLSWRSGFSPPTAFTLAADRILGEGSILFFAVIATLPNIVVGARLYRMFLRITANIESERSKDAIWWASVITGGTLAAFMGWLCAGLLGDSESTHWIMISFPTGLAFSAGYGQGAKLM